MLFTKPVPTPLRYKTPSCFNKVSPHLIEVREDDKGILFLLCSICSFFLFRTLNFLKIFKLEKNFFFSFRVDRWHVMGSLVRSANSLNSIRILPVKAYLSGSPNVIFKYLEFDCQVKLSLFPSLLIYVSHTSLRLTFLRILRALHAFVPYVPSRLTCVTRLVRFICARYNSFRMDLSSSKNFHFPRTIKGLFNYKPCCF